MKTMKLESLRPGMEVTLHSARAINESKAGTGARVRFLGSHLAGGDISYQFEAKANVSLGKVKLRQGEKFEVRGERMASSMVARLVEGSSTVKDKTTKDPAASFVDRGASIVERLFGDKGSRDLSEAETHQRSLIREGVPSDQLDPHLDAMYSAASNGMTGIAQNLIREGISKFQPKSK